MSGYRVNFNTKDKQWIIEKSNSPRAQTQEKAQEEADSLNRDRAEVVTLSQTRQRR